MGTRTPNYELVADRQRWLLYVVLAMLASYLGMMMGPFTIGRGGAPVFLIFGVMYWVGLLAGLVCVILLMLAEARHPIVVILLSLLMFVPVVNLLVLVHVNSEATSLLKARGVRVGLLGAPRSEWGKLRKGHCRGCGYDRSGLELLAECPECGRVPEVG